MNPGRTKTSIDFTIGSRRLLAVGRDLGTRSFTLEEVLSLAPARLNPPKPGADGLRVLSAPHARIEEITSLFPNHLVGGRTSYQRNYIAMADETGAPASFEDYLARFSAKTRSTLRRKARKLEKVAGEFTITEHQTPAETEEFLNLAIPLSAKTHQARLLDAGLPDSPSDRAAMLAAAEEGRMRCFLLRVAGQAVAYLSLPVVGRSLVYAHLGYDSDFARLSPGTVLQIEALKRLFAEQRFAYFDFTEGDGAHKSMFGTDSVHCSSFVVLDPTLANRALLSARQAFDTSVSGAKSIATKSGALGRIRSVLRA